MPLAGYTFYTGEGQPASPVVPLLDKEKYLFHDEGYKYMMCARGHIEIVNEKRFPLLRDHRAMTYKKMREIKDDDLLWSQEPAATTRFYKMTDSQINLNRRCEVFSRLFLALKGYSAPLGKDDQQEGKYTGDALVLTSNGREIPMSTTLNQLQQIWSEIKQSNETIRNSGWLRRDEHPPVDVERLFNTFQKLEKARVDNATAALGETDSSSSRPDSTLGAPALEALKSWRRRNPHKIDNRDNRKKKSPFPILNSKETFEIGRGEPVKRNLLGDLQREKQRAQGHAFSLSSLPPTTFANILGGISSSINYGSHAPSSPPTQVKSSLRSPEEGSPFTEYTENSPEVSPPSLQQEGRTFKLRHFERPEAAPIDFEESLIVRLKHMPPRPYLVKLKFDGTDYNKRAKLADGSYTAAEDDEGEVPETPVRKGRDKPKKDAGGDTMMSDSP